MFHQSKKETSLTTTPSQLDTIITDIKLFRFNCRFYRSLCFPLFLSFLILLLLLLFLLYNIVLVLPYINMNLPLVYMCSQSWTPLPPLSPYHPSGSCQRTSPKHPVSCIEPRLAIHFLYDIIHISMPFSQIIPPFPSPRVQKTVLYICVSFAVSHTGLLLPSVLKIDKRPIWAERPEEAKR